MKIKLQACQSTSSSSGWWDRVVSLAFQSSISFFFFFPRAVFLKDSGSLMVEGEQEHILLDEWDATFTHLFRHTLIQQTCSEGGGI